MPQVSKCKLPNERLEEIFDLFLTSISIQPSKTSIANFLGELLTPTEKIMLSKRVAIGYLLAKNYDYRSISLILKVSTTVGEVATQYKYGKHLKKVVEKLVKDKKHSQTFHDIEQLFLDLLASGGTKSGVWKHLANEHRIKTPEM